MSYFTKYQVYFYASEIENLECFQFSDTGNTSRKCCYWNVKLPTRVETSAAFSKASARERSPTEQ